MATVMSFYGMSHHEYKGLDLQTRNDLWECVTVLEARQALTLAKIADWPNQKQAKRDELHAGWTKAAKLKTKKKLTTAEALQKRLAGTK